MTLRNVIRIMEEKDLPYFPNLREEFAEHANHGDYFFFVIEDEEGEIVGYLIAKKKDKKAVVKELVLDDAVEAKDKEMYQNTSISNLYRYLEKIRDCEGKRVYYQVTLY